jgi:hypothetical protein
VSTTVVNLPYASAPWLANQTNIMYIGNEQKIQAAVANLYGAIGVVAVTNQIESSVRSPFHRIHFITTHCD